MDDREATLRGPLCTDPARSIRRELERAREGKKKKKRKIGKKILQARLDFFKIEHHRMHSQRGRLHNTPCGLNDLEYIKKKQKP
jgi:hypothetical protein